MREMVEKNSLFFSFFIVSVLYLLFFFFYDRHRNSLG